MADEERWFTLAAQDLRMAELARADNLWSHACFHSRQCAEKLLKGSLVRRALNPPPAHKLADLLNILGDNSVGPLADSLRALDRFNMPARYPDTIPGSLATSLPGPGDAAEAISAAKAAYERIAGTAQ